MNTLVLDATTKYITAVMSAAPATTQPDFTAHWADETTTAHTPGETDGTFNGVTPVTLIDHPAASTQRVIKSIIIQNRDTSSVTITINLVSAGGTRQLYKFQLSAGTTFDSGTIFTGVASSGPTLREWVQTIGTFTATPASTSTITMTTDLTASIFVGTSLKYVIAGVTYYGRVSAITSILLTVHGAPLGGDVTALYYGGGSIREIIVSIPSTYESASSTTLILSKLFSTLNWKLPTSYLVEYTAWSLTKDTSSDGKASVRINNAEVNTSAGGLTIAAAVTEYSTVVNIATAAYAITPGQLIEVTCVKGTTGDATYLVVTMTLVTP
jgi:hypothetical protein